MRTSSRSAVGRVAVIAAALFLAGCSASPTTGGSGTTSEAPSGNAGFSAARDAYDLKLAQCLRDAGFDVKDPQPGEGITETGEDLNAAASVCMAELGDPPRADAQMDETEALNTMLGWAECLRERGIEVIEPKLGEAFVLPDDATDEDVEACIPPV